MGKFEKLIVLAVLFSAAFVLAISFNRGGGEVVASDPLAGAEQMLDQESESAQVPESFESASLLPGDGERGTAERDAFAMDPDPAREQAPSLLLHAGLESEPTSGRSALAPNGRAPTITAQPERDSTQRILLDANGLRPSFLDEYMKYTVAQGDTWSSLAQRFYQDGRYTRNLHLANEDVADLTAGQEILVPVFDLIAVEAGLRPGAGAVTAAQPVVAPAETPTAAGTAATAAPVASAASGAKLLEYEVRYGDTLSDISLAVFGSATRWKELLDANKDKLQRPESLQVGMKLKIPEGGKLPAAGAAKPEAKKPETKPAQTAKSAPAASSKKKKVL